MERLTRARSKEKGLAPPRVEDYMESRPRQKRALKVVTDSQDKENATYVPNNKRAGNFEDNDGLVKKFKMSREEKHMNGAPEGELYDVTVLEVHEIKKIEGSDEEVLNRLREELAKCSSSEASWADRFATVEMIRRITSCPEHARLLEEDYVLLVASLESCTHAVGSLRSSSSTLPKSVSLFRILKCQTVCGTENPTLLC